MKEKFLKFKNKTVDYVKRHKIDIITLTAWYTTCFVAGSIAGKWAFDNGVEYGEDSTLNDINTMLDSGVLRWNENFEKNIGVGGVQKFLVCKNGVQAVVEFEVPDSEGGPE